MKLFKIIFFVVVFCVLSHIDYNDTQKNIEYKNTQEYNKAMYFNELQTLCDIHNDTQACQMLGK